ncbi:hypothetical protein DRO60_05020 [Candidatus Bathyarchaeota archaeon]|nr:MAG: hypothetical protein DRO60_05020 [Candidatus Bathyarchaeota archaeon]
MADIVLDTNMFRLLVEEDYVRGVVELCDHIYVAACAMREAKSKLHHLINLIDHHLRLLNEHGKWHVVGQVDTRPFRQAWETVMRHFKGDPCDRQIVELALHRHFRGGQDTMLVSEDYHIRRLAGLMERYGITTLGYDEELDRVSRGKKEGAS